eukprot:m.577532 g.577532  ORF g.577532 m.577532 type:complete len:361 (+) comp22296_c0_seq4:270-1352(+)
MRNRFGVETADAPAPPDACVAFVLVWVVWVSPAGGKRGPRVPSTPDSPTMAATAGVNDDVKDAGLGAWCNGFFADGAVVAAVAKFPSRVIPCDAAAPSTAPAATATWLRSPVGPGDAPNTASTRLRFSSCCGGPAVWVPCELPAEEAMPSDGPGSCSGMGGSVAHVPIFGATGDSTGLLRRFLARSYTAISSRMAARTLSGDGPFMALKFWKSNLNSAQVGSSLGSWCRAKKGCLSASSTLHRSSGSNFSIFWSRSKASGLTCAAPHTTEIALTSTAEHALTPRAFDKRFTNVTEDESLACTKPGCWVSMNATKTHTAAHRETGAYKYSQQHVHPHMGAHLACGYTEASGGGASGRRLAR